jgi:hypothetical protein
VKPELLFSGKKESNIGSIMRVLEGEALGIFVPETKEVTIMQNITW